MVAKLIAELDSDNFTEREVAAQELEYLGKYVRPLLEKARDDSQSAEVKKAIRDLLNKVSADTPPPAPPAESGRRERRFRGGVVLATPAPLPTGPPLVWKRVGRAIAVLEQIGTPEARRLIEAVAAGEDEAFPTRAAKETLQRLHMASGRK